MRDRPPIAALVFASEPALQQRNGVCVCVYVCKCVDTYVLSRCARESRLLESRMLLERAMGQFITVKRGGNQETGARQRRRYDKIGYCPGVLHAGAHRRFYVMVVAYRA